VNGVSAGLLPLGTEFYDPGSTDGNANRSDALAPVVPRDRRTHDMRTPDRSGSLGPSVLGANETRAGAAAGKPEAPAGTGAERVIPGTPVSRLLRMDGRTAMTAKHQRNDEQTGAERPLQEGHEAAARNDEGLTQLLLHQPAQHEAQQQRRRLESELDQRVAEQPERGDHDHVEAGVLIE